MRQTAGATRLIVGNASRDIRIEERAGGRRPTGPCTGWPTSTGRKKTKTQKRRTLRPAVHVLRKKEKES